MTAYLRLDIPALGIELFPKNYRDSPATVESELDAKINAYFASCSPLSRSPSEATAPTTFSDPVQQKTSGPKEMTMVSASTPMLYMPTATLPNFNRKKRYARFYGTDEMYPEAITFGASDIFNDHSVTPISEEAMVNVSHNAGRMEEEAVEEIPVAYFPTINSVYDSPQSSRLPDFRQEQDVWSPLSPLHKSSAQPRAPLMNSMPLSSPTILVTPPESEQVIEKRKSLQLLARYSKSFVQLFTEKLPPIPERRSSAASVSDRGSYRNSDSTLGAVSEYFDDHSIDLDMENSDSASICSAESEGTLFEDDEVEKPFDFQLATDDCEHRWDWPWQAEDMSKQAVFHTRNESKQYSNGIQSFYMFESSPGMAF